MADAPDGTAAGRRDFAAGRLGLVLAVVVGAVACSTTSQHLASTPAPAAASATAPRPTTPAPVTTVAIDVSAAQACALFAVRANRGLPGSDIVTAAQHLMAGSGEAGALNSPMPKWAVLGSDLVIYANDSADPSPDRVKLLGEVNEIIDLCNGNGAEAKAAGGYTDLPHASLAPSP